MPLLTDVLVVALRALTFVGLFQAVGTTIFLRLFEKDLSPALAERTRLLARVAAVAALTAAVLQFVLTPARMAGSLGSTFDPSLEALLLQSNSGPSSIVRVVGLAALAMSLDQHNRLNTIVGNAGAALALVSFALAGHTAIHEQRWALAPLLLVHVAVAAFWFGSLWPLRWIALAESARAAARVLERFSSHAFRLVPAVLVCGLIMSVLFLQSVAELLTGYGALLIGKVLGFAVLMGLAAANKWRFVPGLVSGNALAARNFRRSVAAEWWLIGAILVGTAVMTSLFSPEGLHGAFGAGHIDSAH